MSNPCAAAFSCHALSVSDKGSESCPRLKQPGVPVFGVLYPQSWTPCSGSFPIQAVSPCKQQATVECWVPYPSASLSVMHTWTAAEHDPELPHYRWDAKNKPYCTFQWKCSHLICISADCFFYKPVTVCDASITHAASGNLDQTESLPKIKTCQSRSEHEAVLKLRWRAIHGHRHLTLNSFFASFVNFQLDCGNLTGCHTTTLLPACQNHYPHQNSLRFHCLIQCYPLDSSREAMETQHDIFHF